MAQKHGLGRGLSSLIPQGAQRATSAPGAPVYRTKNHASEITSMDRDYVEEIALGHIHTNSQQPRLYFDEEKLDELATSIKVHGVLQPLVVVQCGDRYELIAGERRLRASKKAGLATVPAVVRRDDDMDEQKKLELALIENIQRHDLNVIEEARSYVRLTEDFGLSQEDIAARTGKSRPVVANRMRLVALPVEIQKALIAGDITEGHAKVILGLVQPQKQLALFHVITQQHLTVRQAETQVEAMGEPRRYRRTKEKTPQARQLEERLAHFFGTKVRVSESTSGGAFTVTYFSEKDLAQILDRLALDDYDAL